MDEYDARVKHDTVKFMKFKKVSPDTHVICKPKRIYLVPSEMRRLWRFRRILKKKSYLW